MATGSSPEEDGMEMVSCFLTPEAGAQPWTLPEPISLHERGPSIDSLLNIGSDELVGFDEDTLYQQSALIREDGVIENHLMDQNTLTLPYVLYSNAPYVDITEQPARRSLRFRYECEIEGRSAGSLTGVNNTAEARTYPTIKVMNYEGPYLVIVSCVTKDGPPYRPHPHNLVGREGCKRGVCTLKVSSPDMKCSFTSLGIQCVRKRDIRKTLKLRQKHNYDPFSTGFMYPGRIDLTVLRLCFQVFLPGPDGYFSTPLTAVVSEPIHDKKAVSDLTIMKLSHCSAPASGGTKVILLCNRVAKDDIEIWFYETQDTSIVWESRGQFQPSDVHKQFAISFLTPPYRDQHIQRPVSVCMELRKPSDNTRGEPRDFVFLPVERDPEGIARKKRKMIDKIKEYLGDPDASISQECQISVGVPRTTRQPVLQRIKAQPPVGLNTNEDHFARPSASTSNSTTVPVSIGGPSASPHLAPATSRGAHSHASASLQRMTESPGLNAMNPNHGAEEDTIIGQFESLDLDLPASWFDISNITYQENQFTNDPQQ